MVGLRPIECSGIVLVSIGERTQLGVAVTGLLAGLSPGSMLVEVNPERQAMLFHVIDAHDPDAVRDHLDRVVAQARDPLAVGGGGGTDDVAGPADHDRLLGDDRARTDQGALTQDATVAKDRAGHEDRAVADLAQVADAGPITWQRCPKTVR